MGTFSHHFDLGDSRSGEVGVCLRILANSRKQALARLKERCDEDGTFVVYTKNDAEMEYCHIYFNFDKVSIEDIDEINDENGHEVDYETTCPHCGAEDCLFVVEANGVVMHSQLFPDGFEVPDEVAAWNDSSKDYSTTDEKVQCEACGWAVEFAELMV